MYLQELRDIAATDAAKGKHFFLESDIKGPSLKLDNTGKAIITVSSLVFLSPFFSRVTNFLHKITKILHSLKKGVFR